MISWLSVRPWFADGPWERRLALPPFHSPAPPPTFPTQLLWLLRCERQPRGPGDVCTVCADASLSPPQIRDRIYSVMIIVWLSSNASPSSSSADCVLQRGRARPGQGASASRYVPTQRWHWRHKPRGLHVAASANTGNGTGFCFRRSGEFWIGGLEACHSGERIAIAERSRHAGETGVNRRRSVHTSLTTMSSFSSGLCSPPSRGPMRP